MNPKLPTSFHLSFEVNRARNNGAALVALESTVITHGLPAPQNLELAADMEQAVRDQGAIPATIAVLDGKIRIGLGLDEVERIANEPNPLKVSLRDFASALTQRRVGGTTVAGTLFAAHQAAIQVFATGGIGGVHRPADGSAQFDISTDLQALSQFPLIVVCAGAKSILDLDATLEMLETLGVPVIGYGTDKFPEFFSPGTKRPVSVRLDNPREVVEFARSHWGIGLRSALLVCQPVPADAAMSASEAEEAEARADEEARKKGISGQALTPFLLKRVNELTKGKSMRANLALLKNNASLAGKIAAQLALESRLREI
ncbi:MAG: pseudouridine-5'-phosphate glycosidase [Anaerolineales bacterium]